MISHVVFIRYLFAFTVTKISKEILEVIFQNKIRKNSGKKYYDTGKQFIERKFLMINKKIKR